MSDPPPGAPGALRGWFRGRMEIGGETVRFEGALAWALPGNLRLEISGPVGGTRAVVIAARHRLLMLLPGRREYLEEAATPEGFEKVLGIPMGESDLEGLAGAAAPGACVETECRWRLPGARALVTRADDRLVVSPPPVPPTGRFTRLELRLRDLEEPAAGLAGDLFDQEIPEGWTRIPTPSAGAPVRPLMLP